mmetsp:Transcript_17745/g.33425  ORF Transcript_17745/g.33425 Transcript_17745/m.33425 type:complete len:274 (+) Transcript_17745:1152-1973(+)
MLSSFELSQDDGPSTKHETKGGVIQIIDRHTLQMRQMSNGGKDGETGDNGKHAVRDANDDRIDHGGLTTRTMRSVGWHGSHGGTEGKEDLRHGSGPNGWFILEDVHFPFSNIFLDTIIGSFEGNGTEQKEKQEENGESHRNVGDAAGPFRAKGQTEPHEEPYQGRVSGVSRDNARGSVTSILGGIHADDFVKEISNGFGSVAAFFGPWIVVPEGIEKGVAHPRQEHTVVRDQNESTKDTCHAHAPKARVHLAKDTNVTALIALSKRDFENQRG